MVNFRFSRSGNESGGTLESTPNTCPYCYYTISPRFEYAQLRKPFEEGILDVIFKCTNESCKKPFICIYGQVLGTRYAFVHVLIPSPGVATSFPVLVLGVSPDFVSIYNQAEYAENLSYDKISGMGYRKALEFLIKDFLITKTPDKAEEIKRTALGNCIKQINDQRIKDVAERATWLGNDETHYVRKWLDKDVSNLKSLIKLVVHFIDAELLYEETLQTMPK